MNDRRSGAVTAVVGLAIWLALWVQVLTRSERAERMSSLSGAATLVAGFVCPYLIFRAVASHWRAPLYELEATVGWGLFTAFVIFVDPGENPPTWKVVVFLGALTVALATICSALAEVTAIRTGRVQSAASFVAARRRGYLVATSVVAAAMLAGSGMLSTTIVMLMVAVCGLVEVLVVKGLPASARGRA